MMENIKKEIKSMMFGARKIISEIEDVEIKFGGPCAEGDRLFALWSIKNSLANLLRAETIIAKFGNVRTGNGTCSRGKDGTMIYSNEDKEYYLLPEVKELMDL
jgi:hypothetical protein